jgi:LPS export ABC transporter protein LptC
MKSRTILLMFALAIISIIVFSCENKIDQIPKSDLLTLPTVTFKGIESIYTDSGKLQLMVYSPLLEQYDNNEFPYTEFRSGIKVIFYDGKTAPVASAIAKYAKYTKSDNTWELKDSVVVINENKDMLETEVLYWDQGKDLIYTDRFVRITNEEQIIQGFGFESDPRLVKRRIKKVNATIYLKEE